MNSSSVLDNLFTRRSVRAYTSDVPAREQMETLVKAGQYAPTGKGMQDTAFLAVTDPALVQQLSALNRAVLQQTTPGYQSDPFYGAPGVIAVFARTQPNAVKNGSAAIENILLAAHALGLGSCWINRAFEVFQSQEGRKIQLENGIPEEYEGVGFVIVGTSAQTPGPAPRRTSIVRFVG